MTKPNTNLKKKKNGSVWGGHTELEKTSVLLLQVKSEFVSIQQHTHPPTTLPFPPFFLPGAPYLRPCPTTSSVALFPRCFLQLQDCSHQEVIAGEKGSPEISN